MRLENLKFESILQDIEVPIIITLSSVEWPLPFPYCVCCSPLSSVLHLYTIVTGLADVADWCLSSAAPGSAVDESFFPGSWFDGFMFGLVPVFEGSPGRDIVKCACTVHSAVMSAFLLLDILFYPHPTHARPMIYIFFYRTRFCACELILNTFFCIQNHGNIYLFLNCACLSVTVRDSSIQKSINFVLKLSFKLFTCNVQNTLPTRILHKAHTTN